MRSAPLLIALLFILAWCCDPVFAASRTPSRTPSKSRSASRTPTISVSSTRTPTPTISESATASVSMGASSSNTPTRTSTASVSPPAAYNPPAKSASSSGLSSSAKVGIAFGVVLGVAVIGIIAFIVYKNHKKQGKRPAYGHPIGSPRHQPDSSYSDGNIVVATPTQQPYLNAKPQKQSLEMTPAHVLLSVGTDKPPQIATSTPKAAGQPFSPVIIQTAEPSFTAEDKAHADKRGKSGGKGRVSKARLERVPSSAVNDDQPDDDRPDVDEELVKSERRDEHRRGRSRSRRHHHHHDDDEHRSKSRHHRSKSRHDQIADVVTAIVRSKSGSKRSPRRESPRRDDDNTTLGPVTIMEVEREVEEELGLLRKQSKREALKQQLIDAATERIANAALVQSSGYGQPMMPAMLPPAMPVAYVDRAITPNRMYGSPSARPLSPMRSPRAASRGQVPFRP